VQGAEPPGRYRLRSRRGVAGIETATAAAAAAAVAFALATAPAGVTWETVATGISAGTSAESAAGGAEGDVAVRVRAHAAGRYGGGSAGRYGRRRAAARVVVVPHPLWLDFTS